MYSYCIGSVCGLHECALWLLIACAIWLSLVNPNVVCGFVSLQKQSFSLLPFFYFQNGLPMSLFTLAGPVKY